MFYLSGAQREELQIQTYSLFMPPKVVNNLRGRGISGRFWRRPHALSVT